MKCQVCGKELIDGVYFCKYCGSQAPVATPETELVGQSGNQISAATRKYLESAGAGDAVTSYKKKASPILPLIIALSALVVVGVVVAILLISKNKTSDEAYADLLANAEEYVASKHYEDAIAAYEDAIAMDGKNQDAYLGLADLYVQLGQYDEAITLLKDAYAKNGSLALKEKLEDVVLGKVENMVSQDDRRGAMDLLMNTLATVSSDRLQDRLNSIKAELEAQTNTEGTTTTTTTTTTGTETTEVPTQQEEKVENPFVNLNIGDSVLFGSYEQDGDFGNGSEPIQWIVIGKDDKAVILMSYYILDCRPFDANARNAWANCSLRNFLNGDFYYQAFNSEESPYLYCNSHPADVNKVYGTRGGSISNDGVFILSMNEIYTMSGLGVAAKGNYEKYMDGDMSWTTYANKCSQQSSFLRAPVTQYAKNQGCSSESGYGYYWLRTLGADSSYATAIYADGGADYWGISSDAYGIGVRPCIEVDTRK